MPEIRRCKTLLGTFVEISLSDDVNSLATLNALADAAFDRIARVQSLMSFHDVSSDISRLNREAHLRPVTVDAWTYKVIAEALRLGEESGGVFDIAIGSVLVEWEFLPAVQSVEKSTGTFRDIVLNDDGSIRFNKPMQIDLGGIAKGFAVDVATELLEAAGIKAGCVNAGGDMRFIGERPATVRVRRANDPWRQADEVPLIHPAVAGSGAYFRSRRHQGKKVFPILNPGSKEPMDEAAAVTVLAPSCLLADALTKIVLLADDAEWRQLLAKYEATAHLSPHAGRKPLRKRNYLFDLLLQGWR